MKYFVFHICPVICCLGLLLSLCACAPAAETSEFLPQATVNANAQRTEITVEGTVDLPDGAILTIQADGNNAARNAILEKYGNYTAMPTWCDNNGFTAIELPAQTAVVQDGKFYASIPMGEAPYQAYPISVSLMPGDGQPDAVNQLLNASADPAKSVIGMHAQFEAVYPNEAAVKETVDAAIEKAKAFIDPQLETLNSICEATAQTYTDLLQSDRKLKQLEPTSDVICTISMNGDCMVMTLDSVYWDYYLHPDLEVYQPDDYRDALAEGWMIPALQQCEGVVQILYGHKPNGKFMASDGRMIASVTSDYQVRFIESSELDSVSSASSVSAAA